MKIPHHLAIIMDGNGRWAQKRGHQRIFGHVKGTRVAKNIITECSKLGVQQLTLYAFSSENWLRPKSEVSFLMKILKRYLYRELKNLVKENIRFSIIGNSEKLPLDVFEVISETVRATAHCTGMHLVFAISYGSQQEITRALQKIAEDVKQGQLQPEEINESTIERHLETAGQPDPDLIIRTSGEMRISNFLLWQAAYAEFYFTDILWPDFTKEDLLAAFSNYSLRQRRYGKVQDQQQLHH